MPFSPYSFSVSLDEVTTCIYNKIMQCWKQFYSCFHYLATSTISTNMCSKLGYIQVMGYCATIKRQGRTWRKHKCVVLISKGYRLYDLILCLPKSQNWISRYTTVVPDVNNSEIWWWRLELCLETFIWVEMVRIETSSRWLFPLIHMKCLSFYISFY